MKTEASDSSPTVEARSTPVSWIVVVSLVFLGFTAGLSELIKFEVGTVTVHFIVAFAVASIGWRRKSSAWPALRRYLRWAGVLAVWLCVSSVAAWQSQALIWSVTASIWLVYIVPGIANLVREETLRKALLRGVIAAALTYAGTALGRMVTGREIFDEPASSYLVLGLKRGLVNARLLYVIPFLYANTPRIARRAGWLGAAAAVVAIVVSGGRSGLLGLVIVGLAFVVTQPGVFGRARAVLVGILLGLIVVISIGEFGGQAVVGKNRLLDYIHGERTGSDDIREIQFNRAWRVGVEHPVFGMGYKALLDLEHPALDDAKNGDQRERARSGGVHNTYAQIFAEFGAPAAIVFILLLASLLRAGFLNNHRREIRAVTAAFLGVMMMMVFHPIDLTFLYYPMAYIVGALGDEKAEPKRRPAAVGIGHAHEFGAPEGTAVS